MEELIIAIEVLEGKKYDTQIEITKQTEYGRWPSEDDFSIITKKSEELKIINAQIEVLTEVKESIENNPK